MIDNYEETLRLKALALALLMQLELYKDKPDKCITLQIPKPEARELVDIISSM